MVQRVRAATFAENLSNRWLSILQVSVSAALVLLLAGCSSALTKLETWEGNPAGAAEAATLKAPGEIHVSHVNGRKMTNYLMDDLALDYALLPGENQVVFTYKTIWAKADVVKSGESKVHVIESKPQVVRFEASPRATYQFEYVQPKNRREAENVMPEFSAAVVDAEGQTLARSVDWSPEDMNPAARTPLPSAQSPVDEPLADDAVSPLERLKAVWGSASDDDKKAFLRWAFE